MSDHFRGLVGWLVVLEGRQGKGRKEASKQTKRGVREKVGRKNCGSREVVEGKEREEGSERGRNSDGKEQANLEGRNEGRK